jgi:hypothetical protein
VIAAWNDRQRPPVVFRRGAARDRYRGHRGERVREHVQVRGLQIVIDLRATVFMRVGAS